MATWAHPLQSVLLVLARGHPFVSLPATETCFHAEGCLTLLSWNLAFIGVSGQRLIKVRQAGGWIWAGIRVLFFSKKKVRFPVPEHTEVSVNLPAGTPASQGHTHCQGFHFPVLTLGAINPLSKRHSWNPVAILSPFYFILSCFQAPYSANALVTAFWFKSIKSKSALFFQMKGDLWGSTVRLRSLTSWVLAKRS